MPHNLRKTNKTTVLGSPRESRVFAFIKVGMHRPPKSRVQPSLFFWDQAHTGIRLIEFQLRTPPPREDAARMTEIGPPNTADTVVVFFEEVVDMLFLHGICVYLETGKCRYPCHRRH